MHIATSTTAAVALALILFPLDTIGAQGNRPVRIDSAAMLTHVRVLSHDSLEGRRVGTKGGLKAREYVRQRFAEIGLQQFGNSFVQQFAAAPARNSGADSLAEPTAPPANVVGFVKGRTTPGRYIVISAHYDHLGVRNGQVFNGADDNASGTGALLALAAYFKKNPAAHSIIFVAMDSEESGLRGARAFVANPPVPLDSVILDVNMDMVGRNDKDELYVTGTLPYPYLKPYIEREQPLARVKLLIGHDEGRGSDNWTNASDHGAFNSARIPFLYFGVEDHPDYHKATDEFQNLMPGFYVRAIETVLDVVIALDADGDAIRAKR